VKIAAIVGIVVVIAFAGIFASQYAQISKDITQVNPSTGFEKTLQSQDKSSTTTSPQDKSTTTTSTQDKSSTTTSTQDKSSTTTSTQDKSSTQSTVSVHNFPSKKCLGDSRCFTGTVSKIIDGDTIVVDGQSIRFALASTPELNVPTGIAAKEFVKKICPVGSKVKVDEDDGQTQGSYGRIIGVVYCNGVNLNQAVIDEGFGNLFFDKCEDSEFSDYSWSGCNTSKQMVSSQTKYSYTTQSNCDPNYEGACIPLNSPDLDCADFTSSIKVVGLDKHGLDRDGDGIACE